MGPEIDPVLVVAAEGRPEAGEDWGIAATPLANFDAWIVAVELGITLQEERYEEWDDESFLVAAVVEAAE